MHPDVEPFARDAAEKQQAFWDAWRELQESNARFMRASSDALSYYTISGEHRRIFDKWIAASKALDEANAIMYERAMDAAGVPADHPLREWLKSRKR
jgi:hypothetical protein